MSTVQLKTKRTLAPAKLNLFLHVQERLPQGYHRLHSLVCFADCADELWLIPDSPAGSVQLSGDFADTLSPEPQTNNLVSRAAAALAALTGNHVPCGFGLKKQIPVAAGLGGGSADAAAVLRLLCESWNLSFQDPSVVSLAKSLGADVPMCLALEPAYAGGIGEQLQPVALPSMPIVLVNPRVEVPTPSVFKGLRDISEKSEDLPQSFSSVDHVVSVLQQTQNDLLLPACKIAPVITTVLDALNADQAVQFAQMSGSGATCFAITNSQDDARQLQQSLAQSHPTWWTWYGRTYGTDHAATHVR